MADLSDTQEAAPGETPGQLAARWVDELTRAESARAHWLTRCKRIMKRYTDEREEAETNLLRPRGKRRFNIFWSNVETLKPAIYARTPKAEVSRRYKDADPVGRVASEVLERALNFSGDAYDFDGRLKACRDQYLLVGRATAWVRYTATFKPDPNAPAPAEDADTLENAPNSTGQISDEPEEVVDTETVEFDYLDYRDFLHSTGRTWGEVYWVSRCAYLTRKELIQRFGEEKGAAVELDWKPDGVSSDQADDESIKKAAVFEIWDRSNRKVFWIAKGYTQGPLDERDDPLSLQDFFPCPPPFYATLNTESLIPIPDFVLYQDQADEIDELTARIGELTDALKVRGFYAGKQEDGLANLLNAKNGTMIPVDSWAAMKEDGGVKGLVEWFPIEMVIEALRECITTRKQTIDDIYQITGISDIMRGDTDPNETAAAQGIKSTFGSSRVRDRQKEMARFARDVLRIKAQVIACKFSPATLAAMTDVKLLSNAEKEQIQQMQQAAQQAAQFAQQQNQPPPAPPPIDPAQLDLMDQPSWEDVIALLENRTLLSFRIDVESDSTAEPDEQAEKQRRIEFLEAIGKFVGNSLPVVQTQPALLPLIMESLKFLVRGFRVGREMEDIIDRTCDQLQKAAAAATPPQPQQPPKGPDPQAQRTTAQAALIRAQAAQASVQVDQGHLQIEQQRMGLEHQQEMAGVQAENYRTHTEGQVAMHSAALDAQTQMRQAVEKAEQRNLIHQVNDHSPMRAPTP